MTTSFAVLFNELSDTKDSTDPIYRFFFTDYLCDFCIINSFFEISRQIKFLLNLLLNLV